MDEIQKVLIKAGRKDLAQKYYEKVSVNDLEKLKAEIFQTLDSDAAKEYKPLINKIRTFADAEQFAKRLGWSKSDFQGFMQYRNINPVAKIVDSILKESQINQVSMSDEESAAAAWYMVISDNAMPFDQKRAKDYIETKNWERLESFMKSEAGSNIESDGAFEDLENQVERAKKFMKNKNDMYRKHWEQNKTQGKRAQTESEPAGYDDLAEVVANDPQLLKQMGREGVTLVDMERHSKKFFDFVVKHMNEIKTKGHFDNVQNVEDLKVDHAYAGKTSHKKTAVFGSYIVTPFEYWEEPVRITVGGDADLQEEANKVMERLDKYKDEGELIPDSDHKNSFYTANKNGTTIRLFIKM